MSGAGCPFCARIYTGEMFASTPHAAAFPDAFPVSDGHMLVVPLRHVADLFELGEEEYAGLWTLVRDVRDHVVGNHGPDGFNVGVNLGAAAGQTIEHAHVHLIPRYDGDRSDPRGGIRWVLPDRAAYWDPDG